MVDFPALPQQRFDSLPANIAFAQPQLSGASAHPTVASMPSPAGWESLLPRAQTPGDMISAAELGAKLRNQNRTDQGRNALAQLYSNPANVDANGTLKPQALAQLYAMGFGDQALAVQGTQSEIASRQATAQTNTQKLFKEQQNNLLSDFAPLEPEWNENNKKYGPDRANQIGQEHYTELVDKAKQSGMYSPQLLAQINPRFDINRLRTNIYGPEGIKKEERATSAETRATSEEARKSERADRERFGEPEYVGKVGDKETPLIYRPGQGYFDPQGNNVTATATNIRKMGTKGAEDIEEAGKPSGPIDKHGEDYLSALPASRSALIRGYAEGRVAFPGSFSLRSPYWQKMVADITQYDPSFDAVNYQARASTRRDFTSGKPALNITSFNTAIGHLGTLEKAGEKLNNTWSPAWNTVANFLITQAGDPRVKEFNTAAQAVASELTRAFRGTGGSLTEVEEWKKNLSAANSPEQIRGVISKGVDLLASRINAVGEQYKRGMGTTADVTDLLTPAARKTLAALPGGEGIVQEAPSIGGTRGNNPPVKEATPAAPQGAGGVQVINTKEERDKLAPGTRYRLPNDPEGSWRTR